MTPRRTFRVACIVGGCGRDAHARALCRSHYERWRLTGDVRAHIVIGGTAPKPRCRVCVAVSVHAGYCAPHYRRLERHGDPLYVRKVVVKTCSVDGCDRPSRARTWCVTHYRRWATTGQAGGAFPTDPCPICRGPVDRSRSVKRMYCSQTCAWESVSGNPSWRRIAARDGLACHICRDDVDPVAPVRSSRSPTVDHLFPRSLGGTHDDANLALAHQGCNASRGIRPMGVNA